MGQAVTPQQWLEHAYTATFDEQRILLRQFYGIVVPIVYRPNDELPENFQPVEEVDQYFYHADIQKLPVLLIVGMLRGTHNLRDILVSRTSFLVAAHTELDKRGENANKLLTGLKPWEHEEN